MHQKVANQKALESPQTAFQLWYGLVNGLGCGQNDVQTPDSRSDTT